MFWILNGICPSGRMCCWYIIKLYLKNFTLYSFLLIKTCFIFLSETVSICSWKAVVFLEVDVSFVFPKTDPRIPNFRLANSLWFSAFIAFKHWAKDLVKSAILLVWFLVFNLLMSRFWALIIIQTLFERERNSRILFPEKHFRFKEEKWESNVKKILLFWIFSIQNHCSQLNVSSKQFPES